MTARRSTIQVRLWSLGRQQLHRHRRARTIWLAAAAAVVACCCGGSVFLTGIFGAIGDGAQAELIACQELPGAGDPAGTAAMAALDAEQRDNGELIVTVGVGLPAPPRAWVIAVATAMQESGLRNLPHQGAANDRDSLGLFQQRPSQGWGTPAQVMDPEYATTAFYQRLLAIDGWERLPLTVAADAVQRSAFPDAYAKHEPLAVALVSEVAGGVIGAAAFDPTLRCAELGEVTAAGWTRPATGPVWSGFRTASRPDHYGADLGAPRGAPVVAAADGLVTRVACQATLSGAPYGCDVDGSPAVAGCGWYLEIRHGDVVTRYCHLGRSPDVAVGELVAAGQPVGVIGSSGRSSGPHLHFEVELQTIVSQDAGGLTVTRAQTDPVTFLAARGVILECPGSAADCDPVHGDRIRTERR